MMIKDLLDQIGIGIHTNGTLNIYYIDFLIKKCCVKIIGCIQGDHSHNDSRMYSSFFKSSNYIIDRVFLHPHIYKESHLKQKVLKTRKILLVKVKLSTFLKLF